MAANKFAVEYHPPDAPWPDGIKWEMFEDCHSKEEAINRFIKLKGADLGEHIIDAYPINWIIEFKPPDS